MTIRVAINGLGRIGRCLVRAIFEENYPKIKLVAVNSSSPITSNLHLLKYDSVHGRFTKNIEADVKNSDFIIHGQKVKLVQERDPEKLPWKNLGVDLVLECTGAFTGEEDASKHLKAGAKKVIISAPSKSQSVKTIVYGVNDQNLKNDDQIISIGSCTTNCLAPIAKILNDNIGIAKGFMTTIHSYTNDQNIVDGSHKDLRRARAAAMSMIPTSTGAAKAIGLVLPELAGKLDGGAIRVPTPNVSMVELNFLAKKPTSKEEINQIVTDAAKTSKFPQILQIISEELVSIDFNHSRYSSCFDTTQTKVIDKDMIKVCAWYDNEWGFSLRMLDIANLAAYTKNHL